MQVGAITESTNTDPLQACGEADAGQTGKAIEIVVTDAGQAFRQIYFHDIRRILRPGSAAAGDVVLHFTGTGNGQHIILVQHPGQIIAALTLGDAGIRKVHPGHVSAVGLSGNVLPGGVIAVIFHRQAGPCEGGRIKGGRDTLETNHQAFAAAAEQIAAQGTHRIGNHHFSQGSTVPEHAIADGSNVAVEMHRFQIIKVRKGIVAHEVGLVNMDSGDPAGIFQPGSGIFRGEIFNEAIRAVQIQVALAVNRPVEACVGKTASHLDNMGVPRQVAAVVLIGSRIPARKALGVIRAGRDIAASRIGDFRCGTHEEQHFQTAGSEGVGADPGGFLADIHDA